MNVNTNSYTVGFACAMVVIVAALLASMSIQLTPLQDRNIELEKKQNILQSVKYNSYGNKHYYKNIAKTGIECQSNSM